ncbi:MAG: PEP-CTERM sorting domain-containing protein [Verrucomicrobiales bacterium]|nr:PEP-CTERM sorting domain-containing protein [Verrucomicrobiales bacterium]
MNFFPMFKLSTVSALAALCLTANAQAVIVYFDPDPDIPISTNYAGVSVDLETGAVSNDLNGLPGGDANFFFGGAGLSNDADATAITPRWHPVRLGTGNTDVVANLSLGTPVDAASTYSTGFGGSGDPNSNFANFTAGTPGYIGFSLELDGGDTVYGWMELTLQDDGITPGSIHRWAFESDAGTAVPVGAIPEPGSASLAFLGVMAFLLRRRR